MKIALAQINAAVGDLNGNQKKIVHFIQEARARGADLVAFPELAVTGYPPEDLLLKDHFVKDSIESLRQIIAATDRIAAVVGYVHKDKNGDLYNAAAVIENKKLVGVVYKCALPNYGVFDEKRYFKEGVFVENYSIKGTKVGITICEDIWIEQGCFIDQVEQGAQVLLNISSSPYDIRKINERKRLICGRARDSKRPVCYVNMVGGQDELVFDGTSLIANAKGQLAFCGQSFAEDLVVADLDELDTSLIEKEVNPVAEVYQALILGARDYVRKNCFQKVILGLSGGIDSAVVAAIACEALGKDNVVGVSMPSQYSSDATRSDAKVLAKNLGIDFKEIPIQGVFEGFLDVLSEEFQGTKPGVAEENIQARIRGNLLMALSNKFNYLLLTTGNKSEVAVGYCTLYGDMCGGFSIIKDVPKTMVYALAQEINARQGNVIPESILTRAPSAELRNDQKDEDSLPLYPVLDQILEGYVQEHRSLEDLVKRAPAEVVRDVIQLVDKSEYKRRQSPPGIKITARAFGRDWRLPITNKYREF